MPRTSGPVLNGNLLITRGHCTFRCLAHYKYVGCFLGDEVRNPGKTIPRALLLSILLVGCLYVMMNVSILGVVPWQEIITGQSSRGLYVISIFIRKIYGPWAANLATVLVMWTAFA